MKMMGEQRISAPRSRVWEALNDPDALRKCIPGCEAVERVSDEELTARLQAKVGPVKARFTGRILMSDVVPGARCRMSGEGTGGAAGFAKGFAQVELKDVPDGTLLAYTVEASVGGKLAQIGGRLIDATAKRMAEEFFMRLEQELAPASSKAIIADAEAVSGSLPDQPSRSQSTQTAPIWMLVACAILVAGLLVAYQYIR